LRSDGLTNLMETSTNTGGPAMIRLAPSAFVEIPEVGGLHHRYVRFGA
jgi:hypothetical protein